MSHTTTETRGTQTNANGRKQSRFERRGSKHPWGFAPPAPRGGRTGVAARPHESHNEYRNRVGRATRYVHLRNQNITSQQRAKEIEQYHQTVARVGTKVQRDILRMKAEEPTFRERQQAYDEARGAYRSRTFLEGTLKMKGIEPLESVEDMLTQYEEWKSRIGSPRHTEQREKAAKIHSVKMEHNPECLAEYGHKERLVVMDHRGPRDIRPSEVIG
tara:strand:+ start:397 stop:1044 length:648 start_codon:yes stop_codon:yes gene_type:complete